LDCTIRDDGLINNHYFTDEFVREAYKALSKSGIDYMEFGYRNSKELFPTKVPRRGCSSSWLLCEPALLSASHGPVWCRDERRDHPINKEPVSSEAFFLALRDGESTVWSFEFLALSFASDE